MTTQALPKRSDVPAHLTWDMTALYATPDDFYADLEQAAQLANELISEPMLNLTDGASIVRLLQTYEAYLTILSKADTYAGAQSAVDMSDSELQVRARDFESKVAKLNSQTAIVEQTLKQADEALIKQAMTENDKYRPFLSDLLAQKPYTLSLELETALISLSPVLDLPYQNYEQCKLADMTFPDFEVNGQTYPLSFSTFENEYETAVDTEFRRQAFKAFSARLRQSQHTIASNYLAQVKKEKIIADMRGYDSVFDYLLQDQKVSREMYDEHIDTIMTHLAPPMRRYAKLLQQVNGIEKMGFADLKAPLDANFVTQVSIEQAKQYCLDALSLLGTDYTDMVQRSFEERWYDFAQNKGKSTGGFCASPYGEHSYVLMSWTQNLGDVFTLIHEIGHAGHFYNAGQYQNYLSYEPSLYFIEAPSTCNELLLGYHLLQQNTEDKAFQRYVVSSLLSNTYYHNFVTHYLEAHFQREVYRAVDAGKNLSTDDLHDMMQATLQQFWGEAVEIDEDAALTWMRQPHYYLGLYSYTYSAGLSIATQLFKKLRQGEEVIDDWLAVLRAGGSKTPAQLAEMVGVDIMDKATLIDTIGFIDELINQAVSLTEQL
ncbi:oligoendopeptidase F [Psychrobacter phenylpyruvicus]|uniref:Oligopeptidase F n=1 Tax=Psychrobacter phenylpyruvicus TaxID=29432 RepID=A0A379LJB6_9GAMM|nr:oligoendopeptidase F [Psychrobacter phenylpyruvicus]SUD89874.1 Oligoendopeptidase F, plasmid [Psychrobacter phenylpyruvicus]